MRFILYETIGASFDFKPYLQTDVAGGFREEMFSDESDYCAVTLDNYAGFDIDAGISTLLPGFTYEQSNHKLGSFNVAHKKIFTSPKHIKTISKPQSYNKGQTYKVEFDVNDKFGEKHTLTVDFAGVAYDYGTSEAEKFDADAYGVVHAYEYYHTHSVNDVDDYEDEWVEPELPETVVFDGVEYPIHPQNDNNG